MERIIKVIRSRNDIIDLLQKYIDVQNDFFTNNYYLNAKYAYGVVLGQFLDEAPMTMKTIEKEVPDAILYHEISLNYKFRGKNELELKEKTIDEFIETDCQFMKDIAFPSKSLDAKQLKQFKTLLYLHYSFENYCIESVNCCNSDISRLKALYVGVLSKKDQLFKYGIVSITDSVTFLLKNPPRIYDSLVDTTFIIKNVPLCLLKIFSEMKSDGMITDIAVRLVNETYFKGRMDDELLTEEVELGRIFDFTDLDLNECLINKLYSKHYEDCLWIMIDCHNITFEELCEDFYEFNNMIVTQVVHLQYKCIKGVHYITHLDHEYIFYSIDEYEKRINNIHQKGEAQKRIKSFKIDNSMIPFQFKICVKNENTEKLSAKNELFLYYVLDCYFKHKDLLSEYFCSVRGR